MSLKEDLSTSTKGISNLSDYLHSIQAIVDGLAFIDHHVDDLDLVIITLNDLEPSIHEFTTSLNTRDTPTI
ncbi:hypothetical protein GYH30_044144 [Glycine max]|uniref:Uncharacterized protein n=1 Tax=Glycine max TaxID=3847 RepID=A0A0R0FY28_SOYBN|nr:hypothetical protein GYH30_044144 [Glycine max]